MSSITGENSKGGNMGSTFLTWSSIDPSFHQGRLFLCCPFSLYPRKSAILRDRPWGWVIIGKNLTAKGISGFPTAWLAKGETKPTDSTKLKGHLLPLSHRGLREGQGCCYRTTQNPWCYRFYWRQAMTIAQTWPGMKMWAIIKNKKKEKHLCRSICNRP